MHTRAAVSFARDTPSLSLEELLGEARDSYALELDIPMTTSAPPLLRTRDAGGRWVAEDAEAGARVGLSMSAELFSRLAPPADYGNSFPVARALDDLRGWCRGRHLETRAGPWLDHRADIALGPELWRRIHRFRPLCARMAFYTVVMRVPLSRLARLEDVDDDRAAKLLHEALRHTWDQRRQWAHADDSGVDEVLAQQRRERREAQERAAAIRAAPVRCRHCGRPFDGESREPCAASTGAVIAAYPGELVLCSPGEPS